MTADTLRFGTFNVQDAFKEEDTTAAVVEEVTDAGVMLCTLPEAGSRALSREELDRIGSQWTDEGYNLLFIDNKDADQRDDARFTGLAWHNDQLPELNAGKVRVFDRNGILGNLGKVSFLGFHANDRSAAARHAEAEVIRSLFSRVDMGIAMMDSNSDNRQNSRMSTIIHGAEKATRRIEPNEIKLENNGFSPGRIRNIIERADGMVGDQKFYEILKTAGLCSTADMFDDRTPSAILFGGLLRLRLDALFTKGITPTDYKVVKKSQSGTDHRLVYASIER